MVDKKSTILSPSLLAFAEADRHIGYMEMILYHLATVASELNSYHFWFPSVEIYVSARLFPWPKEGSQLCCANPIPDMVGEDSGDGGSPVRWWYLSHIRFDS